MSQLTTGPRASAHAQLDAAVRAHLSGDRAGAVRLYRRVLTADPTIAQAHNNLGTLLAQEGQDAEALAHFERALVLEPAYGEAYNNAGILLANRGDHGQAVARFQRALAIEPARAAWLNNLGNSLVELFRFQDALAAYDRAVAIEPTNWETWSNRALALRGLRRPDDAIASFQRSLDLNPSFVNALSNLGIVLKEQKRFADAIAVFERALALDGENAVLVANFAAIYEPMGDYDRVRELAECAAKIDPEYPESYNLLANAAMESARYDEARELYEHVVSLDPENRNANWNLAILFLLHGDFERGWRQFEWRKRLQSVLFDHGEYGPNEWDGSPLAGRTILLHSEQGIGDALQFIRYAPVLQAAGAGRVIVEAPGAIIPLLATVRGVAAAVARGATLPAYDVHANLMSLPGLLGTTIETIPAEVPYIPVEPRPASSMVVAPEGVLKIGIAWAGNPIHQRDLLRSVELDRFRPLFEIPNTKFFSLQKGDAAIRALGALPAGAITDLGPHLDDFRDTASVIARLDLVITVDTSVAHLAGALGTPTWILLPHVPDFRWLLGRSDSPWYPTARLFRQDAPRDWNSVFTKLAAALQELKPSAASPKALEPALAEPVTALRSVTKRADGLSRFDLWVPIAALADAESFSAFEAEMVGEGHERALREFLDEALRSGDAYCDLAPGLGLTLLSVVTAPAAPATTAFVEADEANARRLGQLLDARASGRRIVASTVDRALRHDALGAARNFVVRTGTLAAAEALVRSLLQGTTPRLPDVIAWPVASASQLAMALDALTVRGYVHVVVARQNREVTLDAISDIDAPAQIVSLTEVALAGLGEPQSAPLAAAPTPPTESLTTRPLTIEWNPSAVTPIERRDPLPSPVSRLPSALGLDWQLRTDTGWGVYGLNVALELCRRGTLQPAIFSIETAELSSLQRYHLHEAIVASAERQEALARNAVVGAALPFDAVLLRALGNGFSHGPLWERVRARRNVGMIFFEDTAFDAGARSRADALDLIIAGSSWNADVLRASGIEHVSAVIQGIDPTIFHPAPASGRFGDRFVVYSGGKLEFRKGQDIVVAAFRRFKARHPDALLLTAWHNSWPALISDLDLAGHVVGAPQATPHGLAFAEWLEGNGLSRHDTFDVGRVPNAMMGQLVREANVALFPNRCEGGTNLVAMETMACGVPTIVSANTGHLDLVATGGCLPLTRQTTVPTPTRFFAATDGWGESDVDEIVDALERLYTDREHARSLGARGAAAMQEFTWSNQVDRLLFAVDPLF